MLNKINKESGSVLTLVIITTSLVTMLAFIVFSQINNQIKSNSGNKEYIQAKYYAEAGVEKTIYDICYSIKQGVLNPDIIKYEPSISTFSNNKKNKIKEYLTKAKESLNKISLKNNSLDNKRKALINSLSGKLNSPNMVNDKIINELLEYRDSCIYMIQSRDKKDDVTNIYEAKDYIYLALNEVYQDEDTHTNHTPIILTKNKLKDLMNIELEQIKQIHQNPGRLSNAFNDLYQNGNIENNLVKPIEENFNSEFNKIYNSIRTNIDNIEKLAPQNDDHIGADRNDPIISQYINTIGEDIDKAVNLITKMEQDLDKLIMNFNNDNAVSKIKNIIQNLENSKQQLYEIKCKLGINNKVSNDGQLVSENKIMKLKTVVIPAYNYPNNYVEINDNDESNDVNKDYLYKRNSITFDINAICDEYQIGNQKKYYIKEIQDITLQDSMGINSSSKFGGKNVKINPSIKFMTSVDALVTYSINKWK